MAKEEKKQLLFTVLCDMLPHEVKCYVANHINPIVLKGIEKLSKGTWSFRKGELIAIFWNDTKRISDIKPYLRPLSSMTDAEEAEYNKFFEKDVMDIRRYLVPDYIDWLNAHHFDWRGLIQKGLALPAPEGIYDN